MRRIVTPELMDDPGVDPAALRAALRYIRGVNRRLGGVSGLLRHLKTWSRSWPPGRPVTLIDLGTGSADLPIAARRWARTAGLDLRITAVDNHEETLAAAREELERELPGDGGVELVCADAKHLATRFGDRSFDYAHAGLFLHHMPSDVAVMTVLRVMDRLAVRGIVWNDLVRTRVGYAAIRAMTVGQPAMVRHDARVSVRAGFTRREALDLAERVGITYCRYRWSVFTHRFTLAGERPGAWGRGMDVAAADLASGTGNGA